MKPPCESCGQEMAPIAHAGKTVAYACPDCATGARKPRARSTAGLDILQIPAPLDTPAFRTVWAEWVRYRQSRTRPLAATSFQLQLTQLKDLGHDAAIACIQLSISNGYQGLIYDRFQVRNGDHRPDQRAAWQPRQPRNGFDDARIGGSATPDVPTLRFGDRQ